MAIFGALPVNVLAQAHIPSRTGGPAHNVSVVRSMRAGMAGPAGATYVTCDCAGGRNAFANARIGRNSACHAMRAMGKAFPTAFIPGVTLR